MSCPHQERINGGKNANTCSEGQTSLSECFSQNSEGSGQCMFVEFTGGRKVCSACDIEGTGVMPCKDVKGDVKACISQCEGGKVDGAGVLTHEAGGGGVANLMVDAPYGTKSDANSEAQKRAVAEGRKEIAKLLADGPPLPEPAPEPKPTYSPYLIYANPEEYVKTVPQISSFFQRYK